MKLVLAPMEGVIDHTMRNLLTSLGGIDRCVTEFVRVSSRLLPAKVFKRLCPELASGGITMAGTPVYVQLLGGQPVLMAENAARAAELGALGIDLNFGCPAKTVNNSDGGAIILRNPDRVYDIVTQVRRHVPAKTPVTVKTRLGFEDQSKFLDIVRAVHEGGANELAIHARTKRHGYRPPAYWEEIARAREVTNMPVIANGEIWSPQDAQRCRQVTHCEDLMLGRGALCRPDLPRLIKAQSQSEELTPLHWPDIIPMVSEYAELLSEHYDASYVGGPIKQWLVYLRSYFPQAGPLFEQIKRLRDPEDIKRVLREAAGLSRPVANPYSGNSDNDSQSSRGTELSKACV